MEGGSFLKRPWDPSGNYIPRTSAGQGSTFNSLPAISSSFSYSGSPPERHQQRLPSISAAIDGPVPSPPRNTHPQPPKPKPDDPSTLPQPASPLQGSSKRRRLSYQREAVVDDSLSRRGILDAAKSEISYGHDPGERKVPHQQDAAGVHGDYACLTYDDTRGLVQNVLAGLANLENELRHALSGQFGRSLKQATENAPKPPSASDLGLRSSLHWATISVNTSTRLVHELAISRAFPPLVPERPRDPTQGPSNAGHVLSQESQVWQSDSGENQDDTQLRPGPASTPTSVTQDDHPPGTYLPAETPSTSQSHAMSDYSKRPSTGQHPSYQQYHQHAQSPHRSSSASNPLFSAPPPPSHSPTQLQQHPQQHHPPPHHPTRVLPSPTSIHLPSLPSPNPSHQSTATVSTSAPRAPHDAAATSHLADLQHTISKKTLALTTLQREHDSLLAAFSRQQTRCATLDRKSQVSDSEINSLTEEKIRLQGQVEQLESQVDDLGRKLEEQRREGVENGKQYMEILRLGSRLQELSGEEKRRFNREREVWEEERRDLQRRIRDLSQQLEEGRSQDETTGTAARSSSNTTTSAVPPDAQQPSEQQDEQEAAGVLGTSDPSALKAEVVRLRARCVEMEQAMTEMRGEVGRLMSVCAEVEGIRGRMGLQLGSSWSMESEVRDVGTGKRKAKGKDRDGGV
ncbi:MAG: hypothetical protein Q9227_008978 [Pyrenula ochraceoflavens]